MFQVGKVQGDFYIKVIFDFVYNIINICRIGILLLVRKYRIEKKIFYVLRKIYLYVYLYVYLQEKMIFLLQGL